MDQFNPIIPARDPVFPPARFPAVARVHPDEDRHASQEDRYTQQEQEEDSFEQSAHEREAGETLEEVVYDGLGRVVGGAPAEQRAAPHDEAAADGSPTPPATPTPPARVRGRTGARPLPDRRAQSDHQDGDDAPPHIDISA